MSPPPPSTPGRASQASYVNGDWEISTCKTSILSSGEIDKATDDIGIPMPEMIFGNNYVAVKHKPSGWGLQFTTLPALDLVDKTGERDGLLSVAYSKEWQKSRENTAELCHEEIQGIVKPFDWTYTTSYKGEETGSTNQLQTDTTVEIPLDKLKRPDQILFFDDVTLYEDELGDNGIVVLRVKVRVMKERMLVLSRFFLRVDDVLFRIRDTRLFVEFADGQVIREYQEREAPYKTVLAKVPRLAKDFGQFLRDENWVCQHMPVSKVVRESANIK